jgi:phosphoglycolate phosphatase-like HAD superfamily hydrolase
MIKRIVFDMDNTLVDEFGATVRPGMVEFLGGLKSKGCTLYLWTNSSRDRAREILVRHGLHGYFEKCIFREDYDPGNRGISKDIGTIGGELLIDDDPAEIEFVKKRGYAGFLIAPYRKNMKTGEGEYQEIMRMVTARDGLMKRVFGR